MIGSTSTGSEAGHKWDGSHGTKFMKESGLSLPRTLKDIFVHLAGKIGFEEQKMRKLNIIGFGQSRLPGWVHLPVHQEKSTRIYADVSNFGKSLDVLVEIIHAKTMKIVNDLDNNSNVSRWKQQTKSNSKRFPNIPDVHSTPKKRK
ncbi:9639_t:CDS:2, partial [Funneliformis geosporum]